MARHQRPPYVPAPSSRPLDGRAGVRSATVRRAGLRIGARALLPTALAPAVCLATTARAQDASTPSAADASALGRGCTRVESRTALAEWHGVPVGTVRIAAIGLGALPGPARPLRALHVGTRESTIRRQLTFAAGEPLDSLRVAESLRRLRRLRYLGDPHVIAVRCGEAPLAVTVVTHDEWSTKPTVQMRGGATGGTELGLTERNVLGTGREASLELRTVQGRTGLATALDDPAALGGRATASLARERFRDGSAWHAALASRTLDPREPWRWSLGGAHRERLAPDVELAGELVRRTVASAGVLRRVALHDDAVLALGAGVEVDRTTLRADPGVALVGPAGVSRDFRGVQLGLVRTALRFDTLTWLLPRAAIVDVPTAVGADVSLGVGRDLAAGGRGTVHLDGWVGRAWLPAPRALLTADVWANGWIGGALPGTPAVRAATVRAAIDGWRAAPGGAWHAHLGYERLIAPDPDVRAFRLVDVAARALPDGARLGNGTVSAALDRRETIVTLGRSWALSAVQLGALTYRWDPAGRAVEAVGVGVVGAGLALTPTRAGRGGATLAIAEPVWGSAGVRRRPYVALTLTPWFDEHRRRDGLGTR